MTKVSAKLLKARSVKISASLRNRSDPREAEGDGGSSTAMNILVMILLKLLELLFSFLPCASSSGYQLRALRSPMAEARVMNWEGRDNYPMPAQLTPFWSIFHGTNILKRSSWGDGWQAAPLPKLRADHTQEAHPQGVLSNRNECGRSLASHGRPDRSALPQAQQEGRSPSLSTYD